MSNQTKYKKRLRIQGVPSVVKLDRAAPIPPLAAVIVMMGETGSGKSSFIQSLALNQSLDIARDCLESVTQEVTPYLLGNATVAGKGYPIILVDTPGFSDSRLSEMRIVSMVQQWMQSVSLTQIASVLYFDRITDLRMSGSRWKTMCIFKALVGPEVASRVILVTTMWNLLWNDRQVANANTRLHTLERVYWEDFIRQGLVVTKFRYTPQSALCIINKCLNLPPAWLPFAFQPATEHGRVPSYMKLLVDRLSERIIVARERLQAIDEQLGTTSVARSRGLTRRLRKDEKAIRQLLIRFCTEFDEVNVGGTSNILLHISLDRTNSNKLITMKTWFTRQVSKMSGVDL